MGRLARFDTGPFRFEIPDTKRVSVCHGVTPPRRSRRNPIQPAARPNAIEITARIPCTTLNPVLSSWPAMMKIRRDPDVERPRAQRDQHPRGSPAHAAPARRVARAPVTARRERGARGRSARAPRLTGRAFDRLEQRGRRPRRRVRHRAGRRSGVAIRPWACSTPLNTAGFGSAKPARTTGSSASAWARPSSSLPGEPALDHRDEPLGARRAPTREIVPAAPMHMSGNSIVSSPPSTAERRAALRRAPGACRRRASATACFTPAMFGCAASSSIDVGAEAAPGPGRDVVEDDRHRARVGDGLRGARRCRLPTAARSTARRRARATDAVDVAQGFGGGDRGARAVGAGADDQRRVRGTRTRARTRR